MSKLPPHLQHLADDLPPGKRADIEEAISSSPKLLREISRAEREGLVKHLQMSAPNSNDGGHYDGSTKTIVIGEEAFSGFPKSEQRQNRLDVLASTIGHETEHAFQTRERGQVIQDMRYQMQEALRDAPPGGTVDITNIAGAYLNTMRRFEADAEIAGWQAASSRINEVTNAKVSQAKFMERMAPTTQCIDGDENNLQLAPGIHLDPNRMMSDTRLPKAGPINREPVAQCYFDDAGVTLGPEGKADYRNYYGAYVFENLVSVRTRLKEVEELVNLPRVQIDMEALGLKPRQLESMALNLGEQTLHLTDISRGQSRSFSLRDTDKDTDRQRLEAPPAPDAPARPSSEPLLSDRWHPDFPLFEQAQRGVHALDRERGRTPDEGSDCLAATLAVRAKKEKLPEICVVALSKDQSRAFAIDQHDPSLPHARRAYAEVAPGRETPIDKNTQDMKSVNTELAREAELTLAKTVDAPAPTHSAPVMKIGGRVMSGPSGDGGDGGASGGGGE
jgi:hypothetical protein